MTIKDVEKLTGLTAKSIRFYESKNLISVERNSENFYRNYTDADVTELKRIKLFRYLGFSIEEIEKLMTMDEAEIRSELNKKAETFSNQAELCENKRSLCLILAEDYENSEAVADEYNDTVDFLESDEMSELKEQIKDLNTPNLTAAVIDTLIFAAPVFWLFFNIITQRTGTLLFSGILAIAGTALTVWNWINYADNYKRNKARVKRKNRGALFIVPTLFAALILGIAAVIAVTALLPRLSLPENYLFYEHAPVTGVILICLVMLPIILLCTLTAAKIMNKHTEDAEEYSDLLYIWTHLGKLRVAAVVIWAVALYCCAFNFNAVTGDKIICYSPWNPTGTEYEYSDVESINTGFGNKNISVADYKRKGSFYYQIKIKGKTLTFHCPSVNKNIKRYEEHTYLELEEFDRALTSLEIPKKSDKKGVENCDFDKEYVDRFLRIIG